MTGGGFMILLVCTPGQYYINIPSNRNNPISHGKTINPNTIYLMFLKNVIVKLEYGQHKEEC